MLLFLDFIHRLSTIKMKANQISKLHLLSVTHSVFKNVYKVCAEFHMMLKGKFVFIAISELMFFFCFVLFDKHVKNIAYFLQTY
jgi:hypothetical protein